MKTILPAVALGTAALLLSCEPQPIPITLAAPPVKLVVASQLIPDRIVLVSLTRTFGTLEGAAQRDSLTDAFLEKILVDSALVTVRHQDQVDTLQMLSPGIFAGANLRQSENGSYTLDARDFRTGETITATSVLPPPVRFDRVEPDIVYADGQVRVDVSYAFRDDPAVKNWYLVSYYKKVSLSRGQPDLSNYYGRGSNQLVEFDLVSDENLKDPDYAAVRKLEEVNVSDTIAVSVSNISQGYYAFLSLYKRAGNVITRISGEPVDYPTNVVNGYGYFNTHLPDIRFFDLNKYD